MSIAVRGERAVDGGIRRNVDVRGAVVAVDAIHAALGHLRDLILGELGIFSEIFGDAARGILGVDVGDVLALLVGGDVADLVGDVHVPVNALGLAGGGIAAAGLDEKADLAGRVLLVAGVSG